jgi:hypothetical protein
VAKGFRTIPDIRIRRVDSDEYVERDGLRVLLGQQHWPNVERELRRCGIPWIGIEKAYLAHRNWSAYRVGLNGWHWDATYPYSFDEAPERRGASPFRMLPWRGEKVGKPYLMLGEWDDHAPPYDDLAGVYESMVHWCADSRFAFRPHPTATATDPPFPISGRPRLMDAAIRSRAVLTHHSTAAVEIVMSGIPVIQFGDLSIATPVSGIKEPDRYQWLNFLRWTQWTPEELGQGVPWRYFDI